MYTSSIVKVHVLYMYVYDEKLASLYFYLLIVRRVLHAYGMPRSQSARRGHDLVHFLFTARAGLSARFTPT